MLLSIIIPVYRAEQFLHCVLDSIVCQQFAKSDYEIILIDDGSPDNSRSILLEYASLYTNIKVLLQENGGPGPGLARNVGLKEAQGEYIWFVDSDDAVVPDSLQLIRNTLFLNPNLDIYGFDIWKIYEKDNYKEEYSFTINNPKLRKYYNQTVTHEIRASLRGTIWCFIFSRHFLVKNNLFFYPHILHEDMEFMTRVFFKSKSMFIVDKPIYKYLIRTSGSIMSSIKLNYYDDKLFTLSLLTETLQEKFDDTQAVRYMNTSIFRIAYSIILPNDYSRQHEEQTSSFISSHQKELRNFARKGILPLFQAGEYKGSVSALLMFISPVWLYKILKGKE